MNVKKTMYKKHTNFISQFILEQSMSPSPKKPRASSILKCHMSYVTCQVSPLTCHMSHVTCHVSYVTFFLQSLSVKSLLSTGPTPSIFFVHLYFAIVFFYGIQTVELLNLSDSGISGDCLEWLLIQDFENHPGKSHHS